MANVWMIIDPNYLINNKKFVKEAKYYSFQSGYFYQDIPESITDYKHIGSEVVRETIRDQSRIIEMLQLEPLQHNHQDASIHINYLARVSHVLDRERIYQYLELVGLTVDDLRECNNRKKGKTDTTIKSCTIIDTSTGNTVATGNVDDGRFQKTTPDIPKPVVVADTTSGNMAIMQQTTSIFEKISPIDIIPADGGSIMWEVLNITICEGSVTFKKLKEQPNVIPDIIRKYTKIYHVFNIGGACLTGIKPAIDIVLEKDNNKRLIIGSFGAAAMVFSLAVSATPWGLLGKLIGTLVVDVVFGCLGNLTSLKYEQMLKNQAKAREEE